MTKPPKPSPSDPQTPKEPSIPTSRSLSSNSSRSSAQPSSSRARVPPGPTRRNASFGSSSATGAPPSPLTVSGARRSKIHTPTVDTTRSSTTSTLERRTGKPQNNSKSGLDGTSFEQAAAGSPLHSFSSGGSDTTTRGDMSPSLVDAFTSPLVTGQQTSSTESNKTVRGTGYPGTPDDGPLRTPSYPFPQVTSRRGTPLHQPFTALSPMSPGTGRARDRFLSQGGTSISGLAHKASFTASNARSQNEDYPTPPLYDIVLQLSAEQNLTTWWGKLAQVMREQYGVHRMSLALPVDSTDIENVPWGQKAAYNTGGVHIAPNTEDAASVGASFGSPSPSRGSSVSEHRPSIDSMTRSNSERPSLETRHSYAGYEAERKASIDEEAKRQDTHSRPSVKRRTTTQVLGPSSRALETQLEGSDDSPSSSVWRTAESDNSINWGSGDFKPHADSIIHRSVCTLEKELDPLLESGSVNRVLARNSMVVVVRNFKEKKAVRRPDSKVEENIKGELFSTARSSLHKRASSATGWKYEDYEQPPVNIWSQSPAPSPAMQDDPHDNPFFVAGDLNEDAFEPSSPHGTDYTTRIEAIGVDPSSTIIHIPLVHPLLCKPLAPRNDDPAMPYQGQLHDSSRSPKDGKERKTPIAILSVLSNIVPYPANWANSLKDIGPHLATSFHTCSQNSNIQDRIERALLHQKRTNPLNPFIPEALTPWVLGLGLDTVLSYDNDDGSSSLLGSLTSPSEGYSSHSAHSPSVSPLATPGYAMPPESPASYFDTQRQSLERSRSTGVVPQIPQPGHIMGRLGAPDHYRSQLRTLDMPGSSKEEKRTSKRLKATTSGRSSPTPTNPVQSSSEGTTKEHHHLLLHSHGADFKASFPSLPVAAFPKPLRAPLPPLTAATTPSEGRNVPPSDSLLRTMIDALPVQVFTAEPEAGKVTWVNSRFLSYTGRSTYDVQTNDPWEALHAEDKKDYLAFWALSLRSGQQFQHKARVKRFDGHYRQHYVRAAPLKTVDQRIVHWFGVITDIHDQHTAEVNASKQHETAQSEAKYRALANSSPQIVFAATRARGITFCNLQWPAFSGQSEEDARGVGFMEAVHPDDLIKCKLPAFEDDNPSPSNVPISLHPRSRRTGSSTESSSEQSEASGDTVTAGIEALSPTGLQMPQRQLSELASKGLLSASKDATGKQSYSTEVRLRMASGEYRWHLVRVLLAEPLVSAGNDEETWYGTCTDINDHKELEQTLKDTMDAKSRFLSNMSHEIRTPLNGILGMTNFLIDGSLSPEQEDQVNVIRASTEGLRDLINDILDLSKVEAGMITLTMDWMHIRGVIEDVNDLTSSLAIDKGIELNYMIDANVPSQVKGDRFRFRQVLLNVVGNAIKFTQTGEVFVRCQRLSGRPQDVKDNCVMVKVDVMDTGAGFSSKEADMLFKRFSQIDGSSTRQHGGTGLGLVISMQLVELHGGQMKARSEIGVGSCFTFTIRFGIESELDLAPKTPLSTESRRFVPVETFKDFKEFQPVVQEPTITGNELAESPAMLAPDRLSPASIGSEGSALTGQTSRQSSKSSTTSAGSLAAPGSAIPIRSGSGSYSVKGPRLYSILVLCPWPWAREATVAHLESILTTNIAHTITSRPTLDEAYALLVGKGALNFSHVILYTSDTDVVMSVIHRVFTTEKYKHTCVVVISTTPQRKKMMTWSTKLDLQQLMKDSRLIYRQTPIKPSKLGAIFDPSKERELSTDLNQTNAQHAAANQRALFEKTKTRLGGRGLRVLLVEDNVAHKFLGRVSITVETAVDGVQAVREVTSKEPGYYALVLMDLMMPNKDGYETCRDIRAWEKANDYNALAIVAVSANVLDDVWQRCEVAGFNDYITKPLQFEELSQVMIKILDPEEKDQPLEYMKGKGQSRLGSGSSKR